MAGVKIVGFASQPRHSRGSQLSKGLFIGIAPAVDISGTAADLECSKKTAAAQPSASTGDQNSPRAVLRPRLWEGNRKNVRFSVDVQRAIYSTWGLAEKKGDRDPDRLCVRQ